jgi:hypothetical protein
MSDLTPTSGSAVSPGWYPDPTGKPGQTYWDGSAWLVSQPQPSYAPSPNGGQFQGTAPAWTTTKTLALASVWVGGISIIVDFFFGMGIIFGAAGLVAGLVALNRAKKYHEPTPGLAKAGVILSGISVAFGLVWGLLFFFVMAS